LKPRAEAVAPGVWRLRLPLPWPHLPHCNAWALAAGEGVVLVDTGLNGDGSMEALEQALRLVGLDLADVRQLICTHAHPDHCGQAATIVARTGCELLMHARSAHLTDRFTGAGARLRMQLARQSGVPEHLLPGPDADPGPVGVAAAVVPDRALANGTTISTDVGTWRAIETPGHAPSHVCLFEPGRGLLLCGDHVLERPALHFDYGFTADPVAEYLESLERVPLRGVRLALPGHGRAFPDVAAAVERLRAEVTRRVELVASLLRAQEAPSAYELVVTAGGPGAETGSEHLLEETLAYLRRLEHAGRATRVRDGSVVRWLSA
jgi:glyoxylase-like metal-dependent hydrolase (beta-lactamase superfamily II)